jgi:hypothetical protein
MVIEDEFDNLIINSDGKFDEKTVVDLIKQYKKKLENYIIPKTKKKYTDNTIIKKMSMLNTTVRTYYPAYYPKVVAINIPDRLVKKKQIYDSRVMTTSRLKERLEFRYDEVTSSIQDLKTSKNYYDILACLIIASGRRATEIVARGDFEESKTPHHVLFSGQLKKRRDEEKDNTYEIPLIELTPKEFVKLIIKVRKMKNYTKYTNREIAAKTNSGINKSIKKIFGDTITSETMRTVYAYICYRLYSNQKESEIYYGSKILGHQDNDVAVFARNYNYVFVKETPAADPKRKKKIIKQLDYVKEELDDGIDEITDKIQTL